jgi:glyoxylase-like metal-dependent hydrolase (beta-lactamase superfamily II)
VYLVTNQGWDERILVCRNESLVDTFIIVTRRYVVLVDTVINPKTAADMLALARPYLENNKQLLVVNTHADYDHAWGNQIFAGPEPLQPAPIIASRLCAERLRQPDGAATLQKMQQEEPEIFGEVLFTPPTILFDERLAIDGGDLTLELMATPGHTPDHIAIYIPQIKTLLAADGAEMPFPFARTVEGLRPMRESLARMAALEPAVVLYCHAPVTIGPQLLRHNMAYFDKVEEYCRAALARGAPATPAEDEDVAALVGLAYEEAIPGGIEWQDVDEFYPSKGHAIQIRTMLAHLATAQDKKVDSG